MEVTEYRCPTGVNTYPAVYHYGAGGINIGDCSGLIYQTVPDEPVLSIAGEYS